MGDEVTDSFNEGLMRWILRSEVFERIADNITK